MQPEEIGFVESLAHPVGVVIQQKDNLGEIRGVLVGTFANGAGWVLADLENEYLRKMVSIHLFDTVKFVR